MAKYRSNTFIISLAVLILAILIGSCASTKTGNISALADCILDSESGTASSSVPVVEPGSEDVPGPSDSPIPENMQDPVQASSGGSTTMTAPGSTSLPIQALNPGTAAKPSAPASTKAPADMPATSPKPAATTAPKPTTTATPSPAPAATPKPTTTSAPSPAPVASLTPAPATTPVPAPSGKVILGYYAGWASYSGYKPSAIPASKLTHINYAFAKIGSDLKIALGDPAVDPGNLAALVKLKNTNPDLKILISVGGWNDSGRFSDAALTDASRTAFANSVVDFINKYRLDGVDIDWEYPVSGGLASNARRPEDKQNFTLLLAKLREKLNQQGALNGKHYWLTIAGSAGSYYAKNTELSKMHQYVDYALVMTYDINGAWDAYTGFNAPLYPANGPTSQYRWSVSSAISMYQSAGFPSSKLVMGIPFYGYVYKGVNSANNGLFQTFASGASASYDSIQALYASNPAYTGYISDAAAPWLFNGDTFISYDNADSISKKAAYIKSKKLAGAGIWELSQNKSGTLLNTLYQALH